MDSKEKLKAIIQRGSSLRTLKNWIPKTRAERSRENKELANIDQEVAATMATLSAEKQTEIGLLLKSRHPEDAKGDLIDYVVNQDHFDDRRKASRAGSFRDEPSLRDHVYWIAVIPVLIGLYCVFSWLTTGHIRLP